MEGKMEHERKLGLCRHRIEGVFFSKLWAPCGYRLYYCTEYLGLPQWDREFGNPQMFGKLSFGDMFALGKP